MHKGNRTGSDSFFGTIKTYPTNHFRPPAVTGKFAIGGAVAVQIDSDWIIFAGVKFYPTVPTICSANHTGTIARLCAGASSRPAGNSGVCCTVWSISFRIPRPE